MKGDKSGRKGQLSVATEVRKKKILRFSSVFGFWWISLSNCYGLVIGLIGVWSGAIIACGRA